MPENKRKDVANRLLALAVSLAVALAGMAVYARRCETVRAGVLRLHVVANSDSPVDQDVKLRVRDRLLTAGAACFTDAPDARTAAARVSENAGLLTDAANRVLAESNMPYRAALTVEREYFDTRAYGDVTLPAGTYLAVRVILGAGSGQNWWCVLFPPLCLPAATDVSSYAILDGENMVVVDAENGYEIRFKLVEWWESLRAKWKKTQAAAASQ